MTCFAARLKQLRNQRGLTQTEVAAAIGVTRSVVSLYPSLGAQMSRRASPNRLNPAAANRMQSPG